MPEHTASEIPSDDCSCHELARIDRPCTACAVDAATIARLTRERDDALATLKRARKALAMAERRCARLWEKHDKLRDDREEYESTNQHDLVPVRLHQQETRIADMAGAISLALRDIGKALDP